MLKILTLAAALLASTVAWAEPKSPDVLRPSPTMIADIVAAIVAVMVVIALARVIRAEHAKAKQRYEVLGAMLTRIDGQLKFLIKDTNAQLTRIDGRLKSLNNDTNAQRGCFYKNMHDQHLKVQDELQKRTDEARSYLRERGHTDV
jgi:hypothetical protein